MMSGSNKDSTRAPITGEGGRGEGGGGEGGGGKGVPTWSSCASSSPSSSPLLSWKSANSALASSKLL